MTEPVVRPFDEYKEDIAKNYEQIKAALADNNRSAAMGAFYGLAIQAGIMLDNYGGLFEAEQRRALCAKLVDTASSIAIPTAANSDPDKNPDDYELQMFEETKTLVGDIALENGFPDLAEKLSGGQPQSNPSHKPQTPSL